MSKEPFFGVSVCVRVRECVHACACVLGQKYGTGQLDGHYVSHQEFLPDLFLFISIMDSDAVLEPHSRIPNEGRTSRPSRRILNVLDVLLPLATTP